MPFSALSSPSSHSPTVRRLNDFHLEPEQHSLLRNTFLFLPNPAMVPGTINKLSRQTGLEERFVKLWFKNMRKRLNIDHYITGDDDTEDNEFLEEEVDQSVKESGMCPIDYNPPVTTGAVHDETDESVQDSSVNNTKEDLNKEYPDEIIEIFDDDENEEISITGNIVEDKLETNMIISEESKVEIEVSGVIIPPVETIEELSISNEKTNENNHSNDIIETSDMTNASDKTSSVSSNEEVPNIFEEISNHYSKEEDLTTSSNDCVSNENTINLNDEEPSTSEDEKVFTMEMKEGIVKEKEEKTENIVEEVLDSENKLVTEVQIDVGDKKSETNDNEDLDETLIDEYDFIGPDCEDPDNSVMEVEQVVQEEETFVEVVEEIVTSNELPELTESFEKEMNIEMENDRDDQGPPVIDILSDDEEEENTKDSRNISKETAPNPSKVKEEALTKEEKAEKYDVLKTEFSVLQNKLESLSKALGSHGIDVGHGYGGTRHHPPPTYPYPSHHPYYPPGFHPGVPTPTTPAESSESDPTSPVAAKQEPYGWPHPDYNTQLYTQPWLPYPHYPPYPPTGYPAPYPPYNYTLPYPPPQYPYPPQHNTQATPNNPNNSNPPPPQDSSFSPLPPPYPPHHAPYPPYYPPPHMATQDQHTTNQAYPPQYGPPSLTPQIQKTPEQNQIRGVSNKIPRPSFSVPQTPGQCQSVSPPSTPSMPVLSPQVTVPRNKVFHQNIPKVDQPRTYQGARKRRDVPQPHQGPGGVCVKKMTSPPTQKMGRQQQQQASREVNRVLAMGGLTVSRADK